METRSRSSRNPSSVEWNHLEWGSCPYLYRRDGDTLTFRATFNSRFDRWVPLVPVAVEIGEKAAETAAYLDSGTTRSYVPRSLIEGAGVTFDSLSDPSTLWGDAAMSSRHCPGRILLCDRQPMLEDGFLVPEVEPSPSHHAIGAAFVLGLDVFKRFVVSFDWHTAGTGEEFDNPPTFSLTPAKARQAR